ncbi:hypothetical protein ACG04Q_04895 [Roseateles sp. DXS20W]|uniref:Uncharacterized protein n=1 Tax=Pelomonas lactea TaxID=3299030 RepID=A0ABW7GGA1_9BURK
MKKPSPVGFAALLERMPRSFRKQAKAVEKRARQRREAQAQRFEQAFAPAPAPKSQEADRNTWQDTVASFNGREA